jgi:AAA domain/TrwC relaxase
MRGGGFVAAAFEHRSSRAGDPLLHTHVVVANVTQGSDGRWTALDGRARYHHAKTAGFLYQAALRAEITQRIWLGWGAVVHGVADLEVVPRTVIEHFSRRRAEIVELMEARGERSARAAQVATLETRKAERHVPTGPLRAEWWARAAEHGLTAGRLERVLRVRSYRRAVGRGAERVARRLEGPLGLSRERSTFARRDVLQAFAEAAGDGATVAAIEAHADAFLARTGIVEVGPVAGERRFTTRELLALERDALECAGRSKANVAVARRQAVDVALAARPSLSVEQRALVNALVRSGRGVDVVRAPAGSGKTFAVDAAREAWQRSGVPVLGCALSARAACELRDQAGIEAITIARLTRELDAGSGLLRASVLIVDEAGMVGTRQLARLIQAVDAADAKLVLIGDDRQLPEIEAGGLFRALADRGHALELKEVRRQHDAWDRAALAELRSGDVGRFARAYTDHGRVVGHRAMSGETGLTRAALMTAREVAELLDVPVSTVLEWGSRDSAAREARPPRPLRPRARGGRDPRRRTR